MRSELSVGPSRLTIGVGYDMLLVVKYNGNCDNRLDCMGYVNSTDLYLRFSSGLSSMSFDSAIGDVYSSPSRGHTGGGGGGGAGPTSNTTNASLASTAGSRVTATPPQG